MGKYQIIFLPTSFSLFYFSSLSPNKNLCLLLIINQNSFRPPAPLPNRPMSAGPPIIRHSSMRHLSSMSQSHVPDMISAAKKRFTPPPSTSKSPFNSNLSYGNQFKQNISSQTFGGDKVTVLFN
jgi:hypothetical protein